MDDPLPDTGLQDTCGNSSECSDEHEFSAGISDPPTPSYHIDTLDLELLAPICGLDDTYFGDSGYVLDDAGRLLLPDDPLDDDDDDLAVLLHALAHDVDDASDDASDASSSSVSTTTPPSPLHSLSPLC